MAASTPEQLAEARAARDAAMEFWRVLGEDDDVALRALMDADSLRESGAPEVGLARWVRDYLEATPDQCRSIGWFSNLYLIPHGWVVVCLPVWRREWLGEGEERAVWPISVAVVDGKARVTGKARRGTWQDAPTVTIDDEPMTRAD